MKPPPGDNGRLVQGFFYDIAGVALYPVLKIFSIYLLHHAESPEFPLVMVIITVVVFVRADEAMPCNSVSDFGFGNAVNRKMQFGNPWSAGKFVCNVKTGGRSVFQRHLLAQIVSVSG